MSRNSFCNCCFSLIRYMVSAEIGVIHTKIVFMKTIQYSLVFFYWWCCSHIRISFGDDFVAQCSYLIDNHYLLCGGKKVHKQNVDRRGRNNCLTIPWKRAFFFRQQYVNNKSLLLMHETFHSTVCRYKDIKCMQLNIWTKLKIEIIEVMR